MAPLKSRAAALLVVAAAIAEAAAIPLSNAHLRPAAHPAPPVPSARSGGIAPKRGVVADGCTGTSDPSCTDVVLLSSLGWFYDYNLQFAGEDPANLFVPMNWCVSSFDDPLPAGVNATYYLGVNEPNNLHNCNLPAGVVAQAWSKILKNYPTSRLVSPATAGNGVPWFDAFFSNCSSLYGPTGCKISHVAVHDYSCDPPTTMSYLQEIYQRYGKPVWLTEFSCGDGADGRPTSDQMAYMKAVVPLLDAAPYVFRYSWMSARDKNNKRGLVEVGSDGKAQLTPLGQIYNTL